MNLPDNDQIRVVLTEEFSREHASFEGSKEECDAIDIFIVKCPRYATIVLDCIGHPSGVLHQGAHMLWDAVRLGYQLKCHELEIKELEKINAKS